MAQLAIKGHPTRGKEVIEILEMLGGKSTILTADVGDLFNPNVYFFDPDSSNNKIVWFHLLGLEYDGRASKMAIFTLEEFLEKFPYKVEDRVKIPNCDVACRVTSMIWNDIEIEYETTNSEETFFADELQPYKKETMKEIKIDIPKGYEFAGVDDDNQHVVFTKIPSKYPKTYEECCKVLGCKADDFFTDFSYDGCDVEISDYEDKIDDLLQNFRKLRYCRDAYWKIAGEQLGLGKPWSPSKNDNVYCIFRLKGEIVKDNFVFGDSIILEFPTEEMRDAFYENFKDLIESVKEFL